MTTVIVTTEDQLRDLIRAEVQAAVASVTAPEWITIDAYADRMSVTRETAMKWRRQGKIETKQEGRAIWVRV